ncbi:unnamed protein product, partial [Urochloa humidicola]
ADTTGRCTIERWGLQLGGKEQLAAVGRLQSGQNRGEGGPCPVRATLPKRCRGRAVQDQTWPRREPTMEEADAAAASCRLPVARSTGVPLPRVEDASGFRRTPPRRRWRV